jgi:diacylglycerol kinase family enzyme
MPRDVVVIFNPAAGKARARRRFEQFCQCAGSQLQPYPTQYPGHASQLARHAVLEGARAVIAAGGDGTAHEVLNGIMSAGNPHVAFSILPLGSANDAAFSLGLLAKAQPAPRRVDVGLVQGGARRRFFGCCLGLGLNGAVTVESRKVRRLQGVLLYGLATLRALVHYYHAPPMTLTLDDAEPWTTPTLLFSVLIGKREGGFVMAPRAEMDDGLFDFLHAGPLSRWQITRLLPRLALFGAPKQYPLVRQGRCQSIHVHSTAPLMVHVDGELFCLPEDDARELSIAMLPRAITVAPVATLLATPDNARAFR